MQRRRKILPGDALSLHDQQRDDFEDRSGRQQSGTLFFCFFWKNQTARFGILVVIALTGLLLVSSFELELQTSKSKTKPLAETQVSPANVALAKQTPSNTTRADSARELRIQGMRLVQAHQLSQGLRLIEKAIEIDPTEPTWYSDKAGVLRMMGRTQEALDTLLTGVDRAVVEHGIDYPPLVYIYQGLFFVYKDVGQTDKALEYIKKSTELSPNANQYSLWATLDDEVSVPEKVELYTKALELDPDHMSSFCLRYHTYALLGEWDKMARDFERTQHFMTSALKNRHNTDTYCLEPYHTSYLPFSAELMRETAKLFSDQKASIGVDDVLPQFDPSQIEPVVDDDGNHLRKLRIGYVSSDLNNHPVGRNVLGLFLAHNKEKFDVFCFATKHVAADPYTQNIQAVTTYVDLTQFNNKSHRQLAELIRNYKIDVLVDLNGWTAGRRLQIFAARAAPVQISHGLGFVGTTGLDAFEYFISDQIASPPRFDEYYTEKVIRLPQAYLPAAHQKIQYAGSTFDPTKANKTALRKENDLPESEEVFIYCSFQSLHKISLEAFDTWMSILQSSPNSVLWLVSIKPHSRETLGKRAKEKFGIEADRIIFGDSKRTDFHLMRAQACDLHLDSWPYNAHSTATDIMWAGVPLLVYLPDYHDPQAAIQVPKMCARVSASLLHSLDMPQLIRSTIEEFENEAVRLSNDRQAYEALRNELLEKRMSSRLYDLLSYARHHEKAYLEVFERFLRGEAPSPLDVPLLGST